jgi:Na+-translocating ferredoxin:NAD+ oxidoreductase RnfE subunit
MNDNNLIDVFVHTVPAWISIPIVFIVIALGVTALFYEACRKR